MLLKKVGWDAGDMAGGIEKRKERLGVVALSDGLISGFGSP